MHSLRLHGEYLMMDGRPVDHDLGFTVGVLAAGTKWGNAEPLTKTLNTLATSGSWEVVERFGNRLPSLSVQISAPDPHALNDGEKWLSGLMRPGSLEWLPPMSDVWTVFDVVTATLDIAQDDDWDLEERRFARTYTIPIRALPYARSANLTVTPAETNVIDSSATARQKTSVIYPGGSAPAEGSLHVYHPTSTLGRTVVHTYPLGRPSPALMQYRTASAAPTPDGLTINGEYINIQARDLAIEIPDQSLPTRGLASLWAKIQVNAVGGSTAATFVWTAAPWLNGRTVGPYEQGTVTIEPADQDRILVPLGLVNLPPSVTGPAGGVRLTMLQTPSETGGVVFVDEVWAFGHDDESALTVVDCGEGSPTPGHSSNHLWINAPSVDAPAGQVLVGTAEDNARWAEVVQSSQLHRFPSGGVSVLVATTNALDPAVELAHYRRWTHHAGD